MGKSEGSALVLPASLDYDMQNVVMVRTIGYAFGNG